MQTPRFEQLTSLASYLKEVLTGDAQLTGDGANEYGYTADEVCRAVYTTKLFTAQGDGVVQHVQIPQSKLPLLGVYVDGASYEDVAQSISGNTYPMSARVNIGLQYIFQARSRDAASQAFAEHFAFTVWWILVNGFVVGASQGNYEPLIEYCEAGDYKPLPPFDQSVRAFEADLVMGFKRPPWFPSSGDTSLVVDLADIYADINEKGDTGADPLIKLHWSQ